MFIIQSTDKYLVFSVDEPGYATRKMDQNFFAMKKGDSHHCCEALTYDSEDEAQDVIDADERLESFYVVEI